LQLAKNRYDWALRGDPGGEKEGRVEPGGRPRRGIHERAREVFEGNGIGK